MREIKEELKLDALFTGRSLDKPAENVLIGAMNVKDALGFIQNNSLMIIPGDREDMIEVMCKIDAGRMKKGCRISGIILSGGFMPKRRSLQLLERSNISALITREDTYKIASRVNSMIVKLKPQDTEKIKIIVDMVEKYVDIDKVIGSLR